MTQSLLPLSHRILRHRWEEIYPEAAGYWGKLPGVELAQVRGDFARLVRLLRRHYGYSAVQAEDELERFVFSYHDVPVEALTLRAGWG